MILIDIALGLVLSFIYIYCLEQGYISDELLLIIFVILIVLCVVVFILDGEK